ncbi:hypothetical protein [Rhodopila sp.]|uniref:hypothetical protein n=1 Tax=Rhodopila sp. TaxID=2480087 RepID=UPI002D19C1FA|nr:hypothetical protein [Rhodopila sp.]HVZ10656.1 hypothetical protein [Rhodopila sp.]
MSVQCAFCRDIGWPPTAVREPAEWISLAEYDRRGGRRDGPVSHGACPDCAARVLDEHGLDDDALPIDAAVHTDGPKNPLHASVLKR